MRMSDSRRLMMALALTTGLIAAGRPPAAPPQPTVLQFRGLSASAEFSGSLDACTTAYAYISAFTQVSHSRGGPPTRGEGAYVSYSTYNHCTGTSSYASGFSEDAIVSGNRMGLSVSTTALLYDYYTGAYRTAVLELVFTPNGAYSSRESYHSTSTTPFERINFRFNGRYASSDVSGTLTVDGVEVLSPLTLWDASISESNTGTVIIQRR
jgi:hypothetical protein